MSNTENKQSDGQRSDTATCSLRPTPETDAETYWNSLPKLATSAEIVHASLCRRIERERDDALEEVKRWKENCTPFLVIYAAKYGEENIGKGFLHASHYDLLEQAGARMDAFTRAENVKRSRRQ